MRFILIDKVLALEPGRSIRAIKTVSLAEEYLADHFPTFPVLPGVLSLQGLIESASWLVRVTEGFRHSMILLEEARNVRYKSFLMPGNQIEYTVTADGIDQDASNFVGQGICNNESILEAKFRLRHFNLADKNAQWARIDDGIVQAMKERWRLLWAGEDIIGGQKDGNKS